MNRDDDMIRLGLHHHHIDLARSREKFYLDTIMYQRYTFLVNVPMGTNGVSIDFLTSLSEALGSVSSFTQTSSLFEPAMAYF